MDEYNSTAGISISTPLASYGAGYITTDDKVRRLVGRTMSFIEAIGLPDKQEVSVKEHLKNLLYEELCDNYSWVNAVVATDALSKMRDLNKSSQSGLTTSA